MGSGLDPFNAQSLIIDELPATNYHRSTHGKTNWLY